jgi:dihydrofolate reductase
MRTIRTGLFISLDGIVEADDDWQFAYFDEELMRGIFDGFDGADDLLMGRVSYEGYARLRTEHPDSPVLPLLDARPKHVVSTTLANQDLDWEGATVMCGDVAAGIDALKRSPGGDILLLGSPTLVRWLLSRGLLDELVLTVFPIVVGSGPRLFENMPTERVGLRLTDSRALASGALSLHYAPAES